MHSSMAARLSMFGRARTGQASSTLSIPLPIFEVRPRDVLGPLAQRIHLLGRERLELLGEADVVLQLADGGAADG